MRIWVVLLKGVSTVRRVSLNRCEQLLLEYVERSGEERQYCIHKVQSLAKSFSPHLAAERLDGELWRYFLERASVVPALREFIKVEGAARTSMRNLAEYLLHLWAPARPKSPTPRSGGEP